VPFDACAHVDKIDIVWGDDDAAWGLAAAAAADQHDRQVSFYLCYVTGQLRALVRICLLLLLLRLCGRRLRVAGRRSCWRAAGSSCCCCAERAVTLLLLFVASCSCGSCCCRLCRAQFGHFGQQQLLPLPEDLYACKGCCQGLLGILQLGFDILKVAAQHDRHACLLLCVSTLCCCCAVVDQGAAMPSIH
jgi:hypothetical protein